MSAAESFIVIGCVQKCRFYCLRELQMSRDGAGKYCTQSLMHSLHLIEITGHKVFIQLLNMFSDLYKVKGREKCYIQQIQIKAILPLNC